MNLVIGGKYNWRHQKERLIYIGHDYSNGLWHQFTLVGSPNNDVWCEVREADLEHFEETSE